MQQSLRPESMRTPTKAAHDDWHSVLARYREWSRDEPRLRPLCRLVEELGSGPLANALQPGTSMYTLVISATEGPLWREPSIGVCVGREPGTFRILYQRRATSGSMSDTQCAEADVHACLRPFLNRVLNETSVGARKPPRTEGQERE
jgi:hypothetical protein